MKRSPNSLHNPTCTLTMSKFTQFKLRSHILVGALGFTAFFSCNALAQTQNGTTKYEYDAMGNVTKITNPNNAVSTQSYDALGRLVTQVDPNNASTTYVYDGQNRLIKVTDARNLSTLYTLDGLGNQLGLTSPDTGSTTTTVDLGGNVLTRTDAKGQTTSYSYDVLNRITRIVYHDGKAVNYIYDAGNNAKGRLTQITDDNGSIQYTYDARGRVLSETRVITVNSTPPSQVTSTTAYQYDALGRLSQLTYPNGRRLNYTRDSLGRITQIDTAKDGVNATILSQVVYRPFGGVQSYSNSAGQTYTRGFDLDGRITSYTLNNQVQAISYDAANRIISINQVNSTTQQASYGYDSLDRLTSYITPQLNQSFTYDTVGNRNTQTLGAATTNYSYSSTSNRLTQIAGSQTNSIVMDANGSTTHNGQAQFAYDTRGRMMSATTAAGQVLYHINALGQRVQKTLVGTNGSPNIVTLYHYDLAGKLLGEVTGNNDTSYVYLDDLPIAVIK